MKHVSRLFVCCCILMLLIDCTPHMRRDEEPYMTDRSTDVDASMVIEVRCPFDGEEPKNYQALMHLLGYRQVLPAYGYLDEASIAECADVALQEVLGSMYINAGTRVSPHIVRRDDGVWLYGGGKTYVALRESDGQVLACLDTRVQKHVRKDGLCDPWLLEVTFDVLSADREDLMHSGGQDYFDWFNQKHEGTVTNSQQAYVIALELARQITYGPGSGAFGEYTVYYHAAAKAWVVHNASFSIMIDASTGTCLTCWY